MATAYYDITAIMIDTDKDWTPEAQNKAKERGIILLPSTPCFEAVMLRLLDQNPNGTSQHLKKSFAPYVSNNATDPKNYQKNFGSDMLLEKRKLDASIDCLLKILGA